jgi:signal transduction histidine kinase
VELNQVLIHLAEGTRQALRADAAEVCLLDGEGACLQVAATSGLAPALQKQESISVECSRIDEEALSGQPVVVDDARNDPRVTNVPEDYCSILCAPLVDTDEPLGTVRLYAAAPRFFSVDDMALLTPLVDLGAAAIVAIRTAEALQSQGADTNHFIHVATHELRSPVTAALSLVRGVLKGYAGELTGRQIDILERIGLRLDFLAKLVDDLLDLAAGRTVESVEEGEPMLLNAAVSRVLLLLEPQAEEKGVDITLEPCPARLIVWGTEEGLHRVLVNLVGNAIKYTPSGGSVTIKVQQMDEHARVSVIDTGIGIPEDALPQLFDAFYRAPNAKKIDVVGSGLGLTIARDIVEHYGGTIEVESTVGQGTTFTVTLPIHRLPETVG